MIDNELQDSSSHSFSTNNLINTELMLNFHSKFEHSIYCSCRAFHSLISSTSISPSLRMDFFLSLLSSIPKALTIQDEYGATPLRLLCGGSHMIDLSTSRQMVSIILKVCPAAASIPDKLGQLPLHVVQDVDMATQLVRLYPEGLFVMARGADGGTPLHQAASRGDVRMVKCLYSWAPPCLHMRAEEEGFTPFDMAAAFSESLAVIRYLFHLNPRAIYAMTVLGDTPLHLHISHGDSYTETSALADILRFLISRNPAAVGVMNAYGETPYSLCVGSTVSAYFRRLLLQAVPHLDPQELRSLNYAERRMAMFLFFAAETAREKYPTIFSKIQQCSDNDNNLVRLVVEFL